MADKVGMSVCGSVVLRYFGSVVLLLSLAGCSGSVEMASLNESGSETASRVGQSEGKVQLSIQQAMNLRFKKSGVLEFLTEIPAGSQIEVLSENEVLQLDYRETTGLIQRSSTGFVQIVKIISVPEQFKTSFTAAKINNLNSQPGGVFVSASVVGAMLGSSGTFAAILVSSPQAGFLQNFNSIGKPTFAFASSLKKRFADKLNQSRSASGADLAKWQAIYQELRLAADRKVPTKKSYLMMDQALAMKSSSDFEKMGSISPFGAWSVAVNATAVRHGFANVPCAEFQSELLRQAYQRAGYNLNQDFNSSLGNQLIWSNTASVVGFSSALLKAGWVPWSTDRYRPPTGAFMMHGAGYSPGHTFMAAGDDGQIIIDNGAPQGRDLRKTSAATIAMMFQGGVFFLPPGINPKPW